MLFMRVCISNSGLFHVYFRIEYVSNYTVTITPGYCHPHSPGNVGPRYPLELTPLQKTAPSKSRASSLWWLGAGLLFLLSHWALIHDATLEPGSMQSILETHTGEGHYTTSTFLKTADITSSRFTPANIPLWLLRYNFPRDR